MKANITKLIIFLLLFSGTLAANIFFAVDKRNKSREAARLFLESNNQYLNEDKILSLERMLRDTRTDREELEKYFIKKGDVIPFLKRIEALGAVAGVELDMNAVNDTEKDVLILEFRTTGKFEATFRLLTLLETLPYRTHLERVYITEDDREEDKWNGVFSLWLLSYINS